MIVTCWCPKCGMVWAADPADELTCNHTGPLDQQDPDHVEPAHPPALLKVLPPYHPYAKDIAA